MLEHIYKCEPELCSWCSPIPWKGNSELGLNMVLLCSINMKSRQNIKGKIWIVLVLDLLKTDRLTFWHTLASDLDNISILISLYTFLWVCPYLPHKEKGCEGKCFSENLFFETLSSFISQGWLWEYTNIKALYSVMINQVIL